MEPGLLYGIYFLKLLTMKSIKPLVAIVLIIAFFACDTNDLELVPKVDNGINLIIGDNIFYDDEIEFYDKSSGLIYFNQWVAIGSSLGEKYWFTNNKEVFYEGLIDVSQYCSCDTIGVTLSIQDSRYLNCALGFKSDHFAKYRFNKIVDRRDNFTFYEVFEQHGKLRNGLECNFDTIDFKMDGNIIMKLRITNNDSIIYYYPDPEKMDLESFHFLSSGLQFYYYYPIVETYDNKIKRRQAFTNGAINQDWLSAIKPGTSNYYTIKYENFDALTPGKCVAYFQFPGLNNKALTYQQLKFNDGWIWAGIIEVAKEFTITQ